MRRTTVLRLSLLLCCASAPLAAQDAGNVRVYRCVGSNGAVSLQDAPCRNGRQEVRDMQRPRDPAPRVVRSDRDPTATPAPAAPQREVRHVYVQPPQPLYECVRDDGSRYTSDSGEGNPRWVPIWTSVYLPYGGGHRPPGGGRPPRPLPPIAPMGAGSGSGAVRSSGGSLSISGGGPHVGGSVSVGSGSTHWEGTREVYPGTYTDTVVPTGNVLVRDACNPLPQQDVCARLQDRRWELVRQYNSALQGQRDALSREQRSVDARLERDCR
ncbi:DUF4124 domain-containing protein [Stenotrophomonas rhizophila]|jgi:hypothetical protein|uniref:DUF4124 domain-containing protein n=1 Tax=Stenotrophomonas TaxID=40323 RepID=UPI001F32D962|nr:DUF4124 domain-containing protein [Stenotrophomonas sp. 364]